MEWGVETYGAVVNAELDALPVDMRRRLEKYAQVIAVGGPQGLPDHAFKHLEGKLWELRITGRDGIARVIYATMTQRRVILLRAFVKKTQKTPSSELEIARMRLAALIRNPSGT